MSFPVEQPGSSY